MLDNRERELLIPAAAVIGAIAIVVAIAAIALIVRGLH